jgi:hypothetical protein
MPTPRKWTPHEMTFVRVSEGLSLNALARYLKCSRHCLYLLRRRLGLVRSRSLRHKWEAEFRELHARGWTDHELAAHFGITRMAALNRRRSLGLRAHRNRREKQPQLAR